MLINLTNHPYSSWQAQQKNVALEQFGEVNDLPFPHISPEATEQEIAELADEFLTKILSIKESEEPFAVHLMGELCFCFALIEKLKKKKIKVIASTSERNVVDLGNGKKQITFNFVKFREYL